MKWVVQRHNGELDIPMDDNEDTDDEGDGAGESTAESSSTPRPKSTSTPSKLFAICDWLIVCLIVLLDL